MLKVRRVKLEDNQGRDILQTLPMDCPRRIYVLSVWVMAGRYANLRTAGRLVRGTNDWKLDSEKVESDTETARRGESRGASRNWLGGDG